MSSAAILALILTAVCVTPASADIAFRPPAIPLVTHDPYFSVWSQHELLTADWPRHWTGTVHALSCQVRVDGKPYRLIGTAPASVPPMPQSSVKVLPTRSVFTFDQDGIRITLTFMSPLLPHDLSLVSRPVTYVTWDVQSTDLGPHDVSIYFDATAELVVNNVDQKVTWSSPKTPGLSTVKLGTVDQPVLATKGDSVRIDWGYLYLSVPSSYKAQVMVTSDEHSRTTFAEQAPAFPDNPVPRVASDRWPVASARMDLGEVGESPVSRHLLLAYDDIHSIEYMGKRLRPYWRKSIPDAEALLKVAERDYEKLSSQCAKFDTDLMIDLERAGGEKYALLSALAFRQAIAGQKVVEGPGGEPWMFSKENSSNGCIATVDVMYPACPLPLLFNPKMLRAQLEPVLQYAASPRWKHPFAPHDLGTYPIANGQVYGGGEQTEENQMPVEESANMLLMVAALAKAEGNPSYAKKHWTVLERWAEYLKEKGLDPENQLCTDDFAGHLAHNANLSLKAILALGAFGWLCDETGRPGEGKLYRQTAEDFAKRWVEMADDGDHFRLAFDKPGTWSMKYNLIWDKVLGLDLFDPAVAAKELAFYKTVQSRFGLPLDSRKDWSKLDWLIWTASLADNAEDFRSLSDRAFDFANASPSRVPLSDWHNSVNAEAIVFHARPVVGGLFIKMLLDSEMWKSWSRR